MGHRDRRHRTGHGIGTPSFRNVVGHSLVSVTQETQAQAFRRRLMHACVPSNLDIPAILQIEARSVFYR
jgi:hypothetical protein